MSDALIIVDVQHDFLPGGPLAVPGGDDVITPIAQLAREGDFELVVATRDWHPANHSSFTTEGGRWPVHCVQDTPGAEIDPRVGLESVDAVIDKGTAVDGPGYSGFEATRLGELLRAHDIDTVTLVGLADAEVGGETARDALAAGLAVRVERGRVRGIDPAASERLLDELTAAGATVV